MFPMILTAGPCFQSPKMETESDVSPSQAAVPEHVVKNPMPNPRGTASHAGVKKAFDKRVCITEQQKAEIVQHFMRNPAMSYTDLGEWCKEPFKSDKVLQLCLALVVP
jgi:hypothetical protein